MEHFLVADNVSTSHTLVYTFPTRRRQDLSCQLSDSAVYYSREERNKIQSTGSSSSHTFMCQHILMQKIFPLSLLIPNWAVKVCEPPANLALHECILKAEFLCFTMGWCAARRCSVDMYTKAQWKQNISPWNRFRTGPVCEVWLYNCDVVLWVHGKCTHSTVIWIVFSTYLNGSKPVNVAWQRGPERGFSPRHVTLTSWPIGCPLDQVARTRDQWSNVAVL